MIDFLLIFNTQGKVRCAFYLLLFPSVEYKYTYLLITRFSKWYKNHSENDKRRIISDCYRLISARDFLGATNFLQFGTGSLVYHKYASLYVCTQIESEDNELGALEAIQFFVEALNTEFKGIVNNITREIL